MDFSKVYKDKLISAEKAASLVKSGDWVDYGWSAATPYDFDLALSKRVDELEDVKIRDGVVLRELAVCKADPEGKHFIYHSRHSTGIERKIVNKRAGYFAPLKYSELPRYYRENLDRINVTCIQTAPMDKHGYFNFGIGASQIKAAIEISDLVIVEVNKNAPRALGGFENDVHIDDVDYIIEGTNHEMPTLPSGSFGDVDKKVAEYVVNELVDGACLQLGIGGMPNAIGALIAESDLKDLGVHTEMYVDSFLELSKKGKITGKYKSIDKGRQVYAFAAGSQELYDFIDDNPSIMAAPVDYTNGIDQISALDNFMSINSCINVDLFGQISAESVGTRHISGAGGQLDFVLGAYKSHGGKSFITLPSSYTDKEGVVHSNIVPTLPNGSIVTDTRSNTMYVVTEYGIVNLKGMASRQRAEKLISIAHPNVRDQLIKDAEDLGIWKRSNKR